MLKLVGVVENPFTFLVDPEAEFSPGQMAQFKAVGDEIVCGRSDGTSPFGLIDDIKITNGEDTTAVSGRVTVWMKGIFATDQYDTTDRYSKGATLYCNKDGIFTVSNPSGLCPSVATVTRKPDAEDQTLELVWK